ncbi:SDR family NAD(P)-dependent oxidoreductase [Sphingobium sp. Sx8-8]|uniref:SDR family NAD(P)-dependent oxidoreductase n=1 Tax=Sphingobium sp. Sx8-8 TaxID=2933617 RepID=UPI001F57A4F7|nr:SDR family NAD(P)-dependent oxidoreductase [Sphingobium sp. Sx8-8]
MDRTIAIVGAGAGVGRAVARRFGREGYKVALLARKPDKLALLVAELESEGIEAAAFAIDLRDRPSVERGLREAQGLFGPIDVLEFSPAPEVPGSTMNAIELTAENELYHLDIGVLGAITAVRAVLPSMIERGCGTILLTTAVSALHPLAITASFGIAAGATLNYGRVLNQQLAQHGIYAGVVMIAGLVVEADEAGGRSPTGLEFIASDAIAALQWEMATKHDRVEAIIGDDAAVRALSGRTFKESLMSVALKDNQG